MTDDFPVKVRLAGIVTGFTEWSPIVRPDHDLNHVAESVAAAIGGNRRLLCLVARSPDGGGGGRHRPGERSCPRGSRG